MVFTPEFSDSLSLLLSKKLSDSMKGTNFLNPGSCVSVGQAVGRRAPRLEERIQPSSPLNSSAISQGGFHGDDVESVQVLIGLLGLAVRFAFLLCCALLLRMRGVLAGLLFNVSSLMLACALAFRQSGACRCFGQGV